MKSINRIVSSMCVIVVFVIYINTTVFADVFSFNLKNINDDTAANIISWSNISVASNGWIVAEQYIEISYLTNHSVITGWGLSIYTHNTTNTANPMYIGSNDASGLIDTRFSNRNISLAWLIKDIKSEPSAPVENSGVFTTSDWHWLLDKSKGYTNENNYNVVWNQGGIAWHEAVRQKKPLKAYLYIAAKFEDLLADTYRTTQLNMEEFYNPDALFLDKFFIYTNKWEDSNPVPNHYTPAWESWGSGSSSADFGYTNDYHSRGTSIRIEFTSDAQGAWVWYEPGSDWSCPSGNGYGYDLTGAGKLSFWIKGSNSYNNIIAQIGVNEDSCGTVKNVDGSGGDTFNITTSWTKHYISVTNLNMSYVSRGFKLGVWSPGSKVVLYIDDIKYEK